ETGKNRLDHLSFREPIAQMKPRCPSDLEVIDVLGRRVKAELESCTLQRCGSLKHRYRVIEIGDVSGLRRTVLRCHQAQRPSEIESLLCCELLGSRGAHRTIEVTVQLSLLPGLVLAYVSE
ncbi:MAG: hypothetical protein QOI23_546, partial [Chloroflexota bacterium]|nr:hypothetical protein [Chloroflexota bacterium]